MVIDKDLKKLFHTLMHEDVAEINVGDTKVTVSVIDDASKLRLSTPVYHGQNYIPHSVRHCISEKVPFDYGQIPTELTINEDDFKVVLNSMGVIKTLNNQTFITFLQEFCWLADEWRYYLDEHDRKDRVHVHV